MDRFIAYGIDKDVETEVFLKSNMDRFIEYYIQLQQDNHQLLKSNMDRFIGVTNPCNDKILYGFKIQYG